MNDRNSTKIYSAANSLEAHAVCNLLRSADIDARVFGEHIEATQGMTPFGESGAPYVVVPAGDLEPARPIIDEWEARQAARAKQQRGAPFQFNLKLLLLNMTILALVCGYSAALGNSPNDLFAYTLYLLLFSNWMYLAYRRRYGKAQQPAGANPLAE